MNTDMICKIYYLMQNKLYDSQYDFNLFSIRASGSPPFPVENQTLP